MGAITGGGRYQQEGAMEDNKYDGRKQEPPYQTALDYDSLVAHNAALEQRVNELEVCKEEATQRVIEHAKEARTLRAENERLREALQRIVDASQRYFEERSVSDSELFNPDYVSPLTQAKQALGGGA